MPIKLIGCLSTKNEVIGLGLSPDIVCEFLDFSLHACPVELHTTLQRRIDDSQHYDLIMLTYGRCSRALDRLISLAVPVIMPKAHDCISLLLGSDLKRQQLSDLNPDVYYFSQGWLEYGRDPYAEYLEYLEKYSKEDASYLIQTLYGRYKEAVFIRTCHDEKLKVCRKRLKEIAGFFKWKTSEIPGDLGLLAKVVRGVPDPDVIWAAPGQVIMVGEEESYAD